MVQGHAIFKRRKEVRKALGSAVYVVFLAAVLVSVLGLVVLLVDIVTGGIPWLSSKLILNYPSRHPEQAGLWPALIGTLWLMGLTAAFSVPVGVGAAVYLEEYAPKNRLTALIEINISNLAGVPSVVYGLLGGALFVQWLALDRSVPGRCADHVAAHTSHSHTRLPRVDSRGAAHLQGGGLRAGRDRLAGG